MLAFAEMLKSLTPVKRVFTKGSSFRKHFLEKITDLLAIILSIYLALSMEGWADKRNEHKRLVYSYQNLIEEIEKDTISLTSVISDAELHLKNTKTHIELLKRYKPEIQDSVTRLFSKMMSSQLFYASQMTTYKSMQAGGELKLIDNLAVRDSLTELDELYINLRIYEDMYMDFITNNLTDILKNNFDLIDNKLINKTCYSQLQYRNQVVFFQGLNMSRLTRYKEVLPKAREAMKLIQLELDKNK